MKTRTAEIWWVLHHLDDLDADFARFFRVDLFDLDGPRLFSRAQRVSAYGGIIAMRVAEQNRPAAEPEDDFLPPVPEGAQALPASALSDLIEMR